MPGNVNKAGSHAGSLVQIVLIAPFGPVPDGQQMEITDWNMESEDPSADTRFVLQMSNDNFSANVVEKSRIAMPASDSWTRSFAAHTGNGRLIIPAGYRVRVVALQGTSGQMSSSIIGQTRRLNPDRATDAPGDDFLDL